MSIFILGIQIFLMLGPLFAADTALFLYINQSLSHPLLDLLMPLISHLGSIFLWAPLSIIFLHYRRLLGKRLITGLVPAALVVFSIKHIVARPRPFDVLEGINILDIETLSGFPSGHTTFAFLAAFLLSREFPKYRIPFYIIAVAVALSRIYVGMHFPLDVLAGAIIGLAAGYAVVQLIPRRPKRPRKRRRRKQ